MTTNETALPAHLLAPAPAVCGCRCGCLTPQRDRDNTAALAAHLTHRLTSTGYRRIYITVDGDGYAVRAAYMPSRGRRAFTETTTAEYHGVGAESLARLVRDINQAV